MALFVFNWFKSNGTTSPTCLSSWVMCLLHHSPERAIALHGYCFSCEIHCQHWLQSQQQLSPLCSGKGKCELSGLGFSVACSDAVTICLFIHACYGLRGWKQPRLCQHCHVCVCVCVREFILRIHHLPVFKWTKMHCFLIPGTLLPDLGDPLRWTLLISD